MTQLFDTMPDVYVAETMRGVYTVLREWLKDKTPFSIWKGEGEKWLVVDRVRLDAFSGDESLGVFRNYVTECVVFYAFSYADCLKWILDGLDDIEEEDLND